MKKKDLMIYHIVKTVTNYEEVPESLIWTNIDNRKYNTSKVIEDMKLA